MKTNKEIAEEIRNGTSRATLKLDSFNGLKVQAYNKGELNIPEFIERISEDDPYAAIYLYEGVYIVQDKKESIALSSLLSPSEKENMPKHYDTIVEIYPELKEHVETMASCKSCGIMSHVLDTINGFIVLGGKGRDLSKFKDFMNDNFIEKVQVMEPHKILTLDIVLNKNKVNPKKENNVIKNTVYQHGDFLVPQCLSCVDEHIATAGIYLEQFHKNKIKYMTHYKRAIGHLSHAEIECFHIDIEFSQMIRNEKLLLKENSNYIPKIEELLSFTIIE